MRIQAILVYAVIAIVVGLFILYLGFMTRYYILFFDGTPEMYDFYKQLQVLNKEGFSIILYFVVIVGVLSAFRINHYRPGLAGLVVIIGATIFFTMRSLALISVIPKYKSAYLGLDFTELEDYTPTTFVFDIGVVLHYLLIGVSLLLTIVALMTFVQRLREGKPLVRRLT